MRRKYVCVVEVAWRLSDWKNGYSRIRLLMDFLEGLIGVWRWTMAGTELHGISMTTELIRLRTCTSFCNAITGCIIDKGPEYDVVTLHCRLCVGFCHRCAHMLIGIIYSFIVFSWVSSVLCLRKIMK